MKNTQKWSTGDYFKVILVDGSFGIGQVLDVPMPNVASCAFFGKRIEMSSSQDVSSYSSDDVVGVASVVRTHLDRGVWKVFDNGGILLSQELWPNENTRKQRWVGSKVYTGAIIEDFLNAYFALSHWNTFEDPRFLDNLLIAPSKKPLNLIFK